MSHLNIIWSACRVEAAAWAKDRPVLSGVPVFQDISACQCQCIMRWHQLWASTLFHQTVLIRVIRTKKKQPKIKWRLDGCRVDDFRWVLWSIPSCFCDTCCSPTLSETKHPSIIFCTLTVSSPIAFDFSRLRKVQVRYSKFTNCSSSPRPQRIPTNLGNRLEHFRFAGPAPRSAQAPGVFAGESNVVPWVKIYKICN